MNLATHQGIKPHNFKKTSPADHLLKKGLQSKLSLYNRPIKNYDLGGHDDKAARRNDFSGPSSCSENALNKRLDTKLFSVIDTSIII